MKPERIASWLSGLILLPLLAPGTGAQEWTRFRGPNGQGVSAEKTIPSHWTERDLNWKVELDGKGHSSPVIWGDKIFLTSANESEPTLTLYCLDTRDGKVEWRRDLALVPYALHPNNLLASSTPALDQDHVYLAWHSKGHYKLSAFDHSGHPVWERDFGSFQSQHGSGTSPIVDNGTVYLTKDPHGDSFIVAVNAADGKTRWQTPLHSSRADYSTPCLLPQGPGSKPLLVFTSMDDGVVAFDTETGAVAWRLEKVFSQRCVSSPVLASGLIIGSCGSGGGGNYVAAVRPGDRARNQKPELAYVLRKSAPYVPTSVAVGDLLFLWSDGGIVTCVDAPSGKVHWQERVGGNFFASPISVDGRVFGVSTTGEVIVLEASSTFRVLARNQLEEQTHATPAISQGRLYVRTVRHLISVGGQK